MSEDHYAAVSDRYEEGAFYDPASSYNRWLIPHVVGALGLHPGARLADIGGGTGSFTQALAEVACLETPPCVVEPNPLREQAAARGLQTLAMDADAFASSSGNSSAGDESSGDSWDAILLKEVVHHLSLGTFPQLCEDLAERLAPSGRIVIVTRPVVPDYPLFSAAKIVWRLGQPPAARYAEALRSAGFEVTVEDHAYPFEIPREEWFALIRRRFWSTFSHFSDDQLEVGIAELSERFPEELLSFEERLTFVIARKAPA